MKRWHVRKEALEQIGNLIEEDPRVVFIGSDLGAGTMAEVRERHPERVLMEGIAEQHIVGMSAGLAIDGFVPYVHTIGTFLTRRALEQVTIDVALHDLPVRLIASGGGMVYAPLGPTHEAIEDVALMRAVPGMSIYCPIDPREMREVIAVLANTSGPAYVRLGKGGEPIVTDPGFNPGSIRILRQGSRLLALTTGGIGHECLLAAARLGADVVTVAHIPTVSPLDVDVVFELMGRHEVILVVEEHLPSGGLWTAVVEAAARHGSAYRIHQACLPEGFATAYGSQFQHWEASGLKGGDLAKRIRQLLEEDAHG